MSLREFAQKAAANIFDENSSEKPIKSRKVTEPKAVNRHEDTDAIREEIGMDSRPVVKETMRVS